MNTKKKISFGIVVALASVLLAGGFLQTSRRLTYIEKTVLNDQAEQNIAVMDGQTSIEQEILMPYGLFWGIDVKIGTYGRNNHSFWELCIRENGSGKEIYRWEYNASQVSDGENYFCSVKTPVRVKKGSLYTVSIRSKDATGNSALSFYASEGDCYEEGRLFVNGEERDGDLCIRVYGGERDSFWGFFYLLTAGSAAGVLGYALFCVRKRQDMERAGRLLGALGTACIFMILMYVFTRENMGTFTDECDNIRGGILIAEGKVLYRDYYTQHTPFGYYLCALFACLGAKSIQQFRLLYYFLSAVLWGGLYYRHCGFFGKTRMFFLPIARVVVLMPMFFQASKILGDNIQGVCMVVLVMEYIRYWQDGELGKGRCMVVSVCIFSSIASAFVSVFAIAPIVASVFFREIFLWKERGKVNGKNIAGRYGFLLASSCLPFVISLLYFWVSHAMGKMYLMAYRFNTMVYNNYQEQFGRVKWKPFFLGLKNFFLAVGDNFNSMLTAAGNSVSVIQLVLAVGAVAALLLWWKGIGKKEGIVAVLALLLCMSGNGTRSGTDFHSAALWDVALALIVLAGLGRGEAEKRTGQGQIVLLCLVGCYFTAPYAKMVADHVVYDQEPVSETDEQIIAMTEPGEEIFMDAFVHDSIYLLYKERYPANRNCYILPWYMDWFEYDTLADLEEKKPRIVIYRPETEVYGQTGFCPVLDMAIRGRYERVSEDSVIWKLR